MHIELRGVSVKFDVIPALSNINCILPEGQTTLMIGVTGSGKTTFLRLLFADLLPASGSVFLNGQNTSIMKRSQKHELRRKIGIIFQDCKLLNGMTVFENVMTPLVVTEYSTKEMDNRCLEVLADIGISHLRNKYSHELSGGEKHLVALARAIVHKPDFVIADEPTGNLDAESTIVVAEALQKQAEKGTTVIISTHSSELISCFPKAARIEIHNGKIIKSLSFASKTIQ
ncbi:MAG: ATP-binding cassette domain-containing protein [Ignavibacteria bacterium]|nr:ATP-binding cassette domain-containing protein [Ignavibacteria bacterium]